MRNLRSQNAGKLLRLRSAITFALQGLATARQRALLALLGIMIGVASVVALISIGKGVEQQALAEFEKMGTQVISVSIPPANTVPDDSTSRVARTNNTAAEYRPSFKGSILSQVLAMPEVELASEVFSISCESMQDNRSAIQQLNAINPSLEKILGLKLVEGRFLHLLDKQALWLVLGNTLAQRLASEGLDIKPGAFVSLCGRTMFVAGILASEKTAESSVSLPIDQSAFISTSAASRIANLGRTTSLILRVQKDVSPVEFAKQLENKLSSLTNSNNVYVTTSHKIIELRRQQTAMYTRFLIALSSISLFVGGLGILNIMLVAIVERRQEIGIRLAVGADDLDIAFQFLCESTLLALMGGGLGIIFGLLSAKIVVSLTQLPFVLSTSSIVLALLVSLTVGILSGLYPAIKASRLDPVQTLQGA